jgi:hypothetical protein
VPNYCILPVPFASVLLCLALLQKSSTRQPPPPFCKYTMRAAVPVVCALLVSALLLSAVTDAQAIGGSSRDEEQIERVREELRHAKADLAKAERTLNEGGSAGVVDRLKSMVTSLHSRTLEHAHLSGCCLDRARGDADSCVPWAANVPRALQTKGMFGGGESGTEETAGSDLFHRVKRTVGMGDESLWEKVKDAFQPQEPSIFDKFKSAFGVRLVPVVRWVHCSTFRLPCPTTCCAVLCLCDPFCAVQASPPSWSESVLNRVKHALSGEPTSSKTEDFVHRIKVALGAESPTVGERLSGAWQGATEKVGEMAPSLRQATGITEDTWNSLVHRV